MPTPHLAHAIAAAGQYIAAHWLAFSIGAAILIVLLVIEIYWVTKQQPADMTSNGITIGQAKAFDNRSLALRLERLNAGLEAFKVINQNVTDNLNTFQEQTSSTSSQTVSISAKRTVEKKGADGDAKSDAKKDDGKDAKGDSDSKVTFGLGAADVLNNQLNLASQIFNLQTLYERSLSDRMIGGGSRLQTVLGFQVSLTPPAGYEDCVAVAEIAVRVKPPTPAAVVAGPPEAPVPRAASAPAAAPPVHAVQGAAPPTPTAVPPDPVVVPPAPVAAPPARISLVALMPQEKTYNAESLSSNERSIEGSAVAKVLTLGFSGKRGARQLFIHRDSDTVAFERHLDTPPVLLDNATVFGWEFRPVLGRRTVSPGTRQMLAVVSLPERDGDPAAEFSLEVRTCSYWRRYDRRRQTSTLNWSWLPWRVNRAGAVQSATQELQVPNTAKVQSALAPKIDDIKWVNSGGGKASIVVTGSNFFSGTKVVIGGTTHREEDGTLTLKSDQALEFETTLDALATGDAMLSGRFGPAFQLVVPENTRPAASLNISGATIKPMRNSRARRISINIIGLDNTGEPKDLTYEDLAKLPDLILYVGNEALPMPYDYSNELPDPTAQPQPLGTRYVKVETWISAKTLAKSPSVSFRVPFCGLDYQASQPLSFSEPTVVRMGTDSMNTVFRIFYAQGFPTSDFSVELDQTYPQNSPQLVWMSNTEYRFTVATNVVSRFQNMVVRIGRLEPYLLPIPPEDKPAPKPSIDLTGKPAQIPKDGHGPVEWTGVALDSITDVTIAKSSIQNGSRVLTQVAQQFSTYANGTKLIIYLSAGVTDSAGKITLECTTVSGEKLNIPLFVTES
jgi:hypothetical protein